MRCEICGVLILSAGIEYINRWRARKLKDAYPGHDISVHTTSLNMDGQGGSCISIHILDRAVYVFEDWCALRSFVIRKAIIFRKYTPVLSWPDIRRGAPK